MGSFAKSPILGGVGQHLAWKHLTDEERAFHREKIRRARVADEFYLMAFEVAWEKTFAHVHDVTERFVLAIVQSSAPIPGGAEAWALIEAWYAGPERRGRQGCKPLRKAAIERDRQERGLEDDGEEEYPRPTYRIHAGRATYRE